MTKLEQSFGKGSLMEQLIKLATNGLYGKTAQVTEEKVYRKHMEGLPKANKSVSDTLRVAFHR